MTNRIYFSDIDGTMIDKSDESLNSLWKAIEGFTVVPVTGRSPGWFGETLQLLLSNRTGVFANGALALYTNGVREIIVDKKIGSDWYDSLCSLLEVLQQENIRPNLQYNEVVCNTTANLLKLVESNKKSLIGSNIVYLRFEKERKEAILAILKDASYVFNTSLNEASLLITAQWVDKGTGLSAFVDFLVAKEIINKDEHSLFFGGNDHNDGPVFKMDTIQWMSLQKVFVWNHPFGDEIQENPDFYPNVEFLKKIDDYHAYLKLLLEKKI